MTNEEACITDLQKRSQVERIIIVETLLESIWKEFMNGQMNADILQVAVYCQTNINRIVWKLNENLAEVEL